MKRAPLRDATGCGTSRRPADAGRSRSARCDPPGRRWRHAHGAGSHRAAARRADSAAQQPAAAGRDALQPAARVKQLHDFDFTFQPSLRREQIESLHELGFVERRENVIFLGPPGVGKTHLAISLAIAAAQSGRRVYYGTLADLITSLEEAQAAGRLQARLKILTHPALLVVDEIGYLPISRTGAMLFFQLMTRRYEHASTVLTSNKGFEEWGESSATRSWRRR